MDLGLDGKRAIVTGGSRGIGLASAQTLVAEDAQVALTQSDAGSVVFISSVSTPAIR